MKISKKSLLTMWSIFALAWLWLMFLSVTAEESESYNIELGTDPNNAKQHFVNVEMIAEDLGDNSSAIIKKNWGVVWIETNNNFSLTFFHKKCDFDQDWTVEESEARWIDTYINGWWYRKDYDIDEDWQVSLADVMICVDYVLKPSNKISNQAERSSALWWENNAIEKWYNETILWWNGNKIWTNRTWDSNSILGWYSNELEGGENSIIFWWKRNKISWDNSVIIWSEENSITVNSATVIWNHSEANWSKSIAMWQNTKVEWSNSFLWTDGNHPYELTNNNVFVINWEHGMVVNSKKAHSFAQLTIWGSLVLYYDENAPQCNTETKWVVKVLNNDNKKCLCSCDGSWRNALHDGIMCPFICSNTHPDLPECGHVERDCNGDTPPYSYKWVGASWACAKWTLVEWTGAFFVTTKKESTGLTNYINRSCQSDTWTVVQCHDKLEWEWCPNTKAWKCIWPANFDNDTITNFVNNTYKITSSNHHPTYDTYNRAYNNWEYTNEDCAYYCKEWFIAFEWNCYKCDAWSWDPNDPYKCKFNVDCGEWRGWNKELSKCELNWVCRYKKDDSVFNKNKWLQNITAENIEEILPQENSWEDYYLRCIDEGDNKADYIEHTCAYKCKPWYYCKGWKDEGVCTLPSCNLGQINAHGDKNYYYVTWHATYKQFNATPDWVSTGANETSWRFYSTYANKNGCYYWCPQEYRIKYKGYRRCLSKEQQEGLTDDKYCSPNISIYWTTLPTYKNPTKADQGWTYVSPKELSEKKANKAEWCFWSCEEWSIVAYWQAIRKSTYNYWWNAGQKLIFDSSAKSCYKKCGTWEILDGNGRCKPCPAGEVPNPNSLQTWKFKRIGKYGSNEKAPFLQLYDTTEPAPERIYSDFSEYRICIKDCWTGKVLNQNGECVEKYTAWNCSWEDRKIIGTECVECMQTTSIRSGDDCIAKEWILEYSIKDLTKKSFYTGWEITYEVTIVNKWNIAITGIQSSVKIGNTTERKEYNSGLWVKRKYVYTWDYPFTTNDFTGLSVWQTWNFTITLDVTGTPDDKYVTNITRIPNPGTLTVTIKKS